MKLKGISTPYLDPLEISDDFYNEWKMTLVLTIPPPHPRNGNHSFFIISSLMASLSPVLCSSVRVSGADSDYSNSSTESSELSTESSELLKESSELSTESSELSTKSSELSTSQQSPLNSQQNPLNSQQNPLEISTESSEISTESSEISTDSSDISNFDSTPGCCGGESFTDPLCNDVPNDPQGGLGCKACGVQDCRRCGGSVYIPCP